MRRFYVALIVALGIDLILLPVLGPVAWLPRFTLAIIPFAFLFTTGQAAYITFAVVTIFYWLTTSFNLGIILFSLGITLSFVQRIIPQFFHKDAWQTLVVSASGVLVFGGFLIVISLLMTPNSISVLPSLAISFLLSAALAVGVNKILKK